MHVRYFMKDNFMQDNFMQVTLFFLLNPVILMEKVIKNKGGLEVGPVALQVIKKVEKYSFIRYILSDQV